MSLAKAFARIFWGFSIVLLVVAAAFFVVHGIQTMRSAKITGTLVEFNVVQNAIPYTEEDSGLQNYPVIEYISTDGTSVRYTSPRPVAQDKFSLGDSVNLLVTPGGAVMIDSFFGKWGTSLVLAGTALIFFVFGIAALKGFDQKKY